jgi:hypothetical protein
VATMPALLVSLLIVLAIGLGLVLLVWGVFRVFPTVNRVVTRSFWCPFRRRDVSADFQEDAWDGRPLDVARCTAFEPPSAISCDKACLRLPKLDSPRQFEPGAAKLTVAGGH